MPLLLVHARRLTRSNTAKELWSEVISEPPPELVREESDVLAAGALPARATPAVSAYEAAVRHGRAQLSVKLASGDSKQGCGRSNCRTVANPS